MNPWLLGLCGAFGGLAIEAIEFWSAIRRTGDWPWKTKGETRPGPLAASVVIRIGVGFGLALLAGLSDQLGPLGAVAVGVAAPLLLEQMARGVAVDATGSADQASLPAGPVRGVDAVPEVRQMRARKLRTGPTKEGSDAR